MEERTRNYSRKKRRPDPDTHKKVSKWNALIFFGFIVVADVVLLLSHGRVFSDTENRMLQQAPSLSMQSLTSGKFMNQFEDFVSDQFMARNGWIYSKLKMDKILGKKESNGVFLGNAGYLIEATSVPEEERVSRNVQAINQFTGAHPGLRCVMTIVPNSSEINRSLLAPGAPLRSQREDIGQIASQLSADMTFVDLIDVLLPHSQEDLYYKSDHHWTSLGCRYAFEAMTEKLGIVDAVQKYAIMDAAYDFSGTMAAASGEFQTKDTIQIYVPLVGARADGAESPDLPAGEEAGSAGSQMEQALSTNLKYVAQYFDTGRRSATIYDSQALSGKDKYQVFLGGNHPQIVIHTNADNGRNLLLLKDSYANAFVQFLLPYYSSITIVDPRYYSDDLEQLIREQEITEALILYSENNFMTDRSLYGVLE